MVMSLLPPIRHCFTKFISAASHLLLLLPFCYIILLSSSSSLHLLLLLLLLLLYNFYRLLIIWSHLCTRYQYQQYFAHSISPHLTPHFSLHLYPHHLTCYTCQHPLPTFEHHHRLPFSNHCRINNHCQISASISVIMTLPIKLQAHSTCLTSSVSAVVLDALVWPLTSSNRHSFILPEDQLNTCWSVLLLQYWRLWLLKNKMYFCNNSPSLYSFCYVIFYTCFIFYVD